MRRNKRSITRSLAQTLVAFGALVFLMGAAPAAEAPPFNACSQCHEGMPFGQCAGLTLYAIQSCCGGTGGGWAWCVNSDWGFYVSCDSEMGTEECQCDEWGGNCDSEFRVAG